MNRWLNTTFFTLNAGTNPKSEGSGWVCKLNIPSSDATDTRDGRAESCCASNIGSASNKYDMIITHFKY